MKEIIITNKWWSCVNATKLATILFQFQMAIGVTRERTMRSPTTNEQCDNEWNAIFDWIWVERRGGQNEKKMHTQFVIVNWLLADYEMYWNEECKYKNQLWDGRRRHINSIIEQQLQCVTRKWWRVFVTFAWAFLPEMMRHLYGLVPMSAICPQSSELKFWSPARSSDSLIIVTKHELRQLFKHLYICFTSIVGRAFFFWHRRKTDGKVAARRCWSGWTK